MKICKICGRAMDDNYNVCPYCGVVPEAEPEQNNEQPDYTAPQQQYNQQNQNQYNNVPPHQQGAPLRETFSEKAEIPEYTPAPRPQRSAYVAAFLAIFLGMFGVHNFYLDRKNRALTQLLITVIGAVITFGAAALAMEVWAVIEALKILRGEINTDGTGAMIKMGL